MLALTFSRSERGEKIGVLMLALMVPAIEKFQDAADRIEQVHKNLLVAFALAAYRADVGRYPATLEELCRSISTRFPTIYSRASL